MPRSMACSPEISFVFLCFLDPLNEYEHKEIKMRNLPIPQLSWDMVHHHDQGRVQTPVIVGISECSVLWSIEVADERENVCALSDSSPCKRVVCQSSPDT